MYQESEKGIWKPVLGALGAASVILTIVGNLVFSPKPSTLPTLKMADSEGPTTDRSNSRRASAVMVVPAVQSRQIDESPSLDLSSKPNATTGTNATIGNRPAVTAPVESQKLPCDTASDILLADEALFAEPQPGAEVDIAAGSVEPSMPSAETDNPVLVAERAPVADAAATFEPVTSELAPSELAPSELAPQAGPSIASQPVLVAPVDRPDSPDANPISVSVADACSPTPAGPLTERGQPHVLPVAVDNSATCVVVQKLSHYERKMLRRVAHLEKKRNRQFKDDCALVCR